MYFVKYLLCWICGVVVDLVTVRSEGRLCRCLFLIGYSDSSLALDVLVLASSVFSLNQVKDLFQNTSVIKQ